MKQTKFRAQQTVDSAGVERYRTFADTKNEGERRYRSKRLPQGEGYKIHYLIINQVTIESISNFTELSSGIALSRKIYTKKDAKRRPFLI